MDLSQIGKPGKILSIFFPGFFVLTNLILFSHYSFDNLLSDFLSSEKNNFFLSFVFLCFSYLIGIILRLIKTEYTDYFSKQYLFYLSCRHRKHRKNYYITESFPYIRWIRVICKKNYPTSSLNFFNDVWAPRNSPKGNRDFFNLCKTTLIKNNSELASRCYALEDENRSISGMFYGLVFSTILLIISLILSFFLPEKGSELPSFLLVLYLMAIWYILKSFRFMRIKETLEVFNSTYTIKDKIVPLFCNGHRNNDVRKKE